MVKLAKTFNRITRCKIFVIGDFLLDTYTMGKAKRISPEAPVAVVHVQGEEHKPGGAGNVVVNCVALGAEVVAVGRVGCDATGAQLKETLGNKSIDLRGLVEQREYPTPVKNRVIADNQQIVRVDHEVLIPLSEMLEEKVIQMLPELLEGVELIAISDYGKGFLSTTLLGAVIEQGKARGIPVIADPKGNDFTKYAGATIIKPNLGEAYAAANILPDLPLELAAERLLKITDAEIIMVTRSDKGISLFYRDGKREDFPVKSREVVDVTGAGDTVLAMLTCALANDLTVEEAVQLSNIAAGLAVERLGCAYITLSDLARRLLEVDINNKVFDGDHLFALMEALRDRRFVVLSVTGEEGLTSEIFQKIRKVKESEEVDLLVFVRDPKPCDEFIGILSSLQDVDFVIVSEESVELLCKNLEPEEMLVT